MGVFSHLRGGRGWKPIIAGLVMGLTLGASMKYSKVNASDHDDGETNIKARNLNLTDLFVFRKDWETGVAGDAGTLVLTMCTNPRSLPSQQYFFNTSARYNFYLGRQASRDSAASGVPSMALRYTFGAPNANNSQQVSLQVDTYVNGAVNSTQNFPNVGTTTPATPPPGVPAPVANTVTLAGNNTLTFFAGLREDPFFFDVDAFFRVRAALAGKSGSTPLGAFRTADQSADFAKGYNVNAIVTEIPIAAVQANGETVFDAWETIDVPTTTAALQ